MTARVRQRSDFGGGERGFTLVELLVSVFLTSVILTAAFANFFRVSRTSDDHEMINTTEIEARRILDMMTFELRMAGTGMPLGQAGFDIADATLGTAPYPVLLTSTNSSISFRLNETGTTSVLTAAYAPTNAALTFTVNSAADFSTGDTIYISGLLSGGTHGLQGTVTGVAGNNVSIASSFVATPSATFATGSSVERVALVTYNSPGVNTGITRTVAGATVTVSPRSTFAITYINGSGATLTPPLTAAVLKANLSALDVSVSVRSKRTLQNKSYYTATASQRVGLRDLCLSR